MDDEFIAFEFPEELFWMEEDFPVKVNQSAFVSYKKRWNERTNWSSNHRNVNKRMIEFLRNGWRPVVESSGPEKEKCYSHMIRERMRRQKQKHGYEALHKLLPSGTKNDKNSIIQMAASEIEELLRYKEELERRNNEVEAVSAAGGVVREAKIKLSVAHPSSGIDSIMQVLKCMKNNGTEIRAIRLNFSVHELSALLEIETKMGADEVQKAVNRTLFEVERKSRFQILGRIDKEDRNLTLDHASQ